MKKFYKTINISVLFITFILFCNLYEKKEEEFYEFTPCNFIILVVMVIVVYGIKAIRLYFIMFNQNISINLFLKQYCKVLPVSIIMPFKLGELFKIYCYGYALQNYFNGAVIILLDRFIDTLAIVSLIVILSAIYGTNPGILFYVFIVFIVGIILCYMLLPGMFRYWTHYFIKAEATKNNLRVLEILEKLNGSLIEIQNIVKGRCMILYIISLIAWIVELGGVAIINQFSGERNILTGIMEYLESVLYSSNSAYLRQFILVSVAVMLFIYVVLYFKMRLAKEGEESG